MAIPATDNPWYQRVLLGDQFRSDNSHMAVLPELSEDDLDRITAIEGLEALIVTPDARVKIDFPGVEFPDVTFQEFYFGFARCSTMRRLAGRRILAMRRVATGRGSPMRRFTARWCLPTPRKPEKPRLCVLSRPILRSIRPSFRGEKCTRIQIEPGRFDPTCQAISRI